MTITVNAAYYRKRMIPSYICSIIIDALTGERPVHMHASNVDIERLGPRRKQPYANLGPSELFY